MKGNTDEEICKRKVIPYPYLIKSKGKERNGNLDAHHNSFSVIIAHNLSKGCDQECDLLFQAFQTPRRS